MTNDNFRRLRPSIRLSSMWVLTTSTICILAMSLLFTPSLSAQFLPPPPVPNLNVEDDDKNQIKEKEFQFPKTFQPPVIEFMNEVLRDGKNVFKINITSEAPIENCKIKFIKGEVQKTVDCVKDTGTIYKALVDATQPDQTVYINASDIYGDSSSTFKRLTVLPQLTFTEAIWNSLSSMIDSSKIIVQDPFLFVVKSILFLLLWE
jgi:hypothetical protein